MMMDKDGNVLSINEGFENMYEYSFKEFIAARGSNYRKTSFSPKVIERIDYIFKNKKPFKYEALNITKTGKELWTQTALVPLLDKNGNVDGMVTIDTDIHKRIVSSDKLIERMELINAQIDSMSKEFRLLELETRSLFESINQLQELFSQTDQIVRFIKEISDKTKILGINASIEANIAGAHGRGFRVVANEIVEISNKTIASVQEISQLLSSVSNNQEQLQKEKQISEESIASYQKLIKTLKKDIREIEAAINEFKTLT
jgi:PAS domain S-box-containing protein